MVVLLTRALVVRSSLLAVAAITLSYIALYLWLGQPGRRVRNVRR